MLASKGIVVKCTAAIFYRTLRRLGVSALNFFYHDVIWLSLTYEKSFSDTVVQLECWFRWIFCIPFSPLQFEVSPTGTPENPSSLSMVGKKPVILCRHSYLKSAFSLSESLNRLNMQQHTMWLLVENPYVACSLRKQPTLRDATASCSPRNVWNSSPKKFSWATTFLGGRLYGRFDSTGYYYTATSLIALQG